MAAEPKRIKAASFYIDGAKIGTATDGTFTITENGEGVVTAEGWSRTDGAITSELDINAIVPVSGESKRMKTALKKRQYVTAQVSTIDGDVETVVMRATSAAFSTNVRSGTLTGAFKFEGGEPESDLWRRLMISLTG